MDCIACTVFLYNCCIPAVHTCLRLYRVLVSNQEKYFILFLMYDTTETNALIRCFTSE